MESDGNITDILTSDEEDSSIDNDNVEMQGADFPIRQPNPWFSVVDKETFELNVIGVLTKILVLVDLRQIFYQLTILKSF